MSSTLLQVDELGVSYGLVRVLDGASLTVGRGEVVTILGSNGAGKTTLLRSIAGLVRHQAGHIQFDGVDIGDMPAHEKVACGLCMVPEGRQLFPDHSVLENLELGAFHRLRAGEKSAVDRDMMDVFELFPRVRERLSQKAADSDAVAEAGKNCRRSSIGMKAQKDWNYLAAVGRTDGDAP